MKTRKISKQREWAIKKQKAGLCPLCGDKTGGYFYCKTHRESHNAYRRKRYAAEFGGLIPKEIE